MKTKAERVIKRVLLFSALTLFVFVASAQNKVVVIPLFSDQAKPIKNVVIVAKENGDFNNPAAAVNSIANASASNPYLVLIAPGEYQLGAQQIVLKPYIELSGSGKIATRLVASRGSSEDDATAAVIVGADNSTISNLSITNTRTNSNSFGIHSDSAKIKIENVFISMESGPASGFQVGIYNTASTTKILHADIRLVGGGNQIPVFSLKNNETIIENINTLTSGGSSFQSGIGSFNSKTSINRAVINVTGGSSRQWGISASGAPGNDSTLELSYVKISVDGGATNDQLGIELATQAPMNRSKIDHSIITVDGGNGAFAAGISLLQAGDLTMSNSEISTSGATDISRGLTQNIGTSSTIRASKISGTESSVFLSGGSPAAIAYISDTFFFGGTAFGNGNYNCSFVFMGFGLFQGSLLDSNCQTGL